MLLWTLGAVAWACDAQTLQAAISDAETAFNAMDDVTFEEAAAAARESLDCQAEPMTPIQCAGYHRLRALDAFFQDDEAATILAFQAVLATQPGYQLSTDIAPIGHPLRDDFEQAKQYETPETFALKDPADGWLQIDGRRTGAAPAGRPFVFQHLDATGGVRSTAYVGVGAPVPSYEVAATPDPVPTPLPEPVPVTKSGPSAPLVGTGVALAVAAGALYGGAFAARSSYDDAVAAGDEQKIRGAFTTTNALTISSLGAAGLGTTLIVVGFL